MIQTKPKMQNATVDSCFAVFAPRQHSVATLTLLSQCCQHCYHSTNVHVVFTAYGHTQ